MCYFRKQKKTIQTVKTAECKRKIEKYHIWVRFIFLFSEIDWIMNEGIHKLVNIMNEDHYS